ncbi:IPT/TIG domain-containing protein [Chitinophaga sp. Cy-1792]|uniref:IPT/TIG domain-containing protein n=1 Tax=Chitinophaga sp. Cy-1792 TaxID=2608339 RepID=UPI00141DDFB6|nr:IPT/TIG domain-containing protein [Chitinophaga sp. Cy-1792]NIG55907.1 hypothetical protein [Chitinophaga sp. Cy-1792]
MKKNIVVKIMLAGWLSVFISCEKDAQFRQFSYPAPVVSDFSPKQGYALNDVTIAGSDFGEVTGAVKVYFDGVLADTVRSVTSNKIVVQAPQKGATGKIAVVIFGKSDSTQQVFTYKPSAKLTGMSTTSAQVGDDIVLTGLNFGTDKSLVQVYVGNVAAQVVSVAADQVHFTVPQAPSGTVTLKVDGQNLTGAFLLVGVVKLSGTLIGHSGSWSNNPATMISAAVDGNIATYVDAATATGYVGYDMGAGASVILKSVRYVPRSGNAARMVGGEIRGANDPSLSDFVTLYTITTAPATGVYTEAAISSTARYRYVYYYSAAGYCNIAEIEFYGSH